MFIHFLCLCPLRLTIMLNFNILKVAYLGQPFSFKIICAIVTWNNKITAYPKEINPICDIRKHRGEKHYRS